VGRHRDWTPIREEYQRGEISYADLAKKYGVSLDTLKKAAAREGWTRTKAKRDKRERAKERRVERVVEKAPKGTGEKAPVPNGTEGEEERRARFSGVVERLLVKIDQAVDMTPPDDTRGLKSLSGALKDLAALGGWSKDELDIEEQQARIAKLRADTQAAQAVESREPVEIRFVETEGAEE
jgi:uncharacterized protein YjcR